MVVILVITSCNSNYPDIDSNKDYELLMVIYRAGYLDGAINHIKNKDMNWAQYKLDSIAISDKILNK